MQLRWSKLPIATALAIIVSGCSIVPKPFTTDELSVFAEDNEMQVDRDQEPVNGSIGLYEAMARALKYNLDHRVELMEIALRHRQLDLAHYSMLPKTVVSAGYANRNNHTGGASRRLPIGTPSLSADTSSTSSERDVVTGDIQFSWNILDFGLSYVRANQAADRVLIARETRRKVVNRLIQDVRIAYWRSVSAERLIRQLRALAGRVDRALSDSRALSSRGQSSPLTALTYERELVEIKREIQRLYDDLSVAKTQLAALINVRPGSHFHITIPRRQREPRRLGLSAKEMIEKALQSRSEMRDVAYQTRINYREAEAAILEILPGVSFTGSPNYNSNSFLFNQSWVAWGAQASWNLLKVFSLPARTDELVARDALLRQRALAVTMAVMTQVHVGRARLIHARQKYRTSKNFFDVQHRILIQIRRSLEAGRVSEQTAIREEMNTLVARVKLDLAFVELQNAFATAHASVGSDPVDPDIVGGSSVNEVATALREGWRSTGDMQTTVYETTGAEPVYRPRRVFESLRGGMERIRGRL